MTFIPGAHEGACTTEAPCKNCRGYAFLRPILGKRRLAAFVAIMTGDDMKLPSASDPLPKDMLLDDFVMHFGLGCRTRHTLWNEGARTLGDILKFSAPELLRAPNFGHTSLGQLENALDKAGYQLAAFRR